MKVTFQGIQLFQKFNTKMNYLKEAFFECVCVHTCVFRYVYNQIIRVEVRGQPREQVSTLQSCLFVAVCPPHHKPPFALSISPYAKLDALPPQLPEWSPPISLRECRNCTVYY